jgi:hypothetical protein
MTCPTYICTQSMSVLLSAALVGLMYPQLQGSVYTGNTGDNRNPTGKTLQSKYSTVDQGPGAASVRSIGSDTWSFLLIRYLVG